MSLLEVLTTVAIMGVVGSMGVAQMGPTVRSMKGDGAMRLVMSQLNIARQTAITQRHNIEVQFVGGNWIRIIRHETPGVATTLLTSVALEGNATFSLVNGVPDTPDLFGNANALNFGAAQVVMFGSDGTFIDGNGNPLNGSIFLSILGAKQATRAVTVLGSTGRVRGYKALFDTNGLFSSWSRI